MELLRIGSLEDWFYSFKTVLLPFLVTVAAYFDAVF